LAKASLISSRRHREDTISPMKWGKRGTPIKGCVKRRNTSPLKIIDIFFEWHLVRYSLDSFSSPVTHPLFHFIRFNRSAKSDPHQSPIRIKVDKSFPLTSSYQLRGYFLYNPWQLSLPQKIIGSIPCPKVDISQILWLLASPFFSSRHRQIRK
jgi:hypothetical protein